MNPLRPIFLESITALEIGEGCFPDLCIVPDERHTDTSWEATRREMRRWLDERSASNSGGNFLGSRNFEDFKEIFEADPHFCKILPAERWQAEPVFSS